MADLFEGALPEQGKPGEWSAQYAILANEFIRSQPVGSVFNGEALRVFMIRRGLAEARHPNVWGAMANHALSGWFEDGRIERAGVSPAESAKAHARRYPTYRKVK